MKEHHDKLAHSPNAKCPQCKNPMRINPSSAKRSFQCKKCNYFFQGSRGIAQYTPPPPPKPPSSDEGKGLLGRIFK